MTDDVVLNKVQSIERCLARVTDEYAGDPTRLENRTVEDAIVLNLQRACQATIDLAMHVVSKRRLGVPGETREAFDLLQRAGIISADLTRTLRAMVGFRNVAVHQYQDLDRRIVRRIIERHLEDFRAFAKVVIDLEPRGV